MYTESGEKLWFRARSFGYGWTPVSWEGWLILGLFLGILFYGVDFLSSPDALSAFFFLLAADVAALIGICILKGETPYWRWGAKTPVPPRRSPSASLFLLFLIPILFLVIGFWLEANPGPATDMAPMASARGLEQPAAAESPIATSTSSTSPALIIGNETIHLDVADTPALQEHGLSDRPSLLPETGMIFVFSSPSDVGFWMKDMNFSLDMIWLDQNYRIITIKQDATPQSFPAVFYPASPASYVLELPAGFAASHGLSAGSKLVIEGV